MNPETAHSRIAGLDFLWDIEMALEAGKLFHIHLNSQDGQRYDQELPFGYTEPLKDLALLVTSRPRSQSQMMLLPRRDRHNFIDLHVFFCRIQRVSGGVEFLGRLEHGLRAEGGPGVVSGKKGLEFTDDFLGSGFRDQVAFDLQLERLLEERGSGVRAP